MKTVDGVLQKDYLTIAEHFLTTLSLSVILFVVLRVFAHGLGTRDVSGRVDERLILQDDKLFYIFRTRFVTTSGGANVIMIPFKKIRDVIYYEKTSEILLLGDFMGDTFAFFSDDCPVDPSSVHLSEIAIYDYFEPDVYPIILEATNGNAGSPQIGCSVCEEVSTENG